MHPNQQDDWASSGLSGFFTSIDNGPGFNSPIFEETAKWSTT